MPEPEGGSELRTAELAEIIRTIQERVRSRFPATVPTGTAAVALADLMPLVHARDAAQGKVAAIGTVNPRPPGPLNALIQAAKRLIARLLDWHVREQVEFNRGMVSCVNATLEALNQLNRSMAALAEELRQKASALSEEARQARDIRSHWNEWRSGWEKRLAETEIRYLRAVAELQAAFDQRVREGEAGFGYRLAQAESAFRELAGRQHADFSRALAEAGRRFEEQITEEFRRIRLEVEREIHSELRTLRQRLALMARQSTVERADRPREAGLDWLRFAERFRGSEESVKAAQRRYVEEFRGCRRVVDLGCGRGEFLELMAEAGISARGVDASAECVALVRAKGFEADQADLFDYLEALADGSLDGIFCAHVIEHLPVERLPALVGLSARKLERGGRLVIETPNPACLAIFATHFYADPTHVRPVPASLVVFYLEEAGFGGIEVRPLSPAVDAIAALAELPEGFRETFFGGLDYAVLARRL